MVVGRTATEEWRADLIFRALADRTRRDVIRRAMSGTLSVSGLARLYPMSTTAVQKHVAVLEEAGLVHLRRHGRQQLCDGSLGAIGLGPIANLLCQLTPGWQSAPQALTS